jgi:hypothetical protein
MVTTVEPTTRPAPMVEPREDLNPCHIAQLQFDIAAEHLRARNAVLRQIALRGMPNLRTSRQKVTRIPV